ncbi:cytidine deaminase [Marinicella litoralis]|uniref:Cytidine deaminase n=1 Tax=Marinicella litoralis TaxID=644220 RepID=A0A4R6XMG7_9GAMM|nr:cytidine deaminase [Marinicella litoralis]TDR18493.1 cytidine deaminase [Marinicella litoralis]
MKLEALFEAAKMAHKKAYSPYSNFKVGAAILDDQDQVHIGCNVENAAYPIGCCAEQSAVSQMIVNGGTKIKDILVIGKKGQACPPCGACRQIIFEHGSKETKVHLETSAGKFVSKNIGDLLPDAFDHSHLDK